MALGSKSSFFYQSKSILSQYRVEMIDLLIIRDFSEYEISFYLEAYDYFVDNPENYDGATASEDLNDIPGLELDSMSHDFDYVAKNVSGSFKYKRISDKIMFKNMSRNSKSGFERYRRSALLWLLSYVALFPLWNKRKMSEEDERYMFLKQEIFLNA